MIARCPECKSSGKLGEEFAGRQVSCPKCGVTFIAKAATTQTKWYYADGNNKIGPIKQEQFDSLIGDNTITSETLVWCKGMEEWLPLAKMQQAPQTKWFYADGDNKIGPIKQEQFDSLVDDGTFAPETLVWCKGMEGWQSLSDVQQARQTKWYYADGDNKIGPIKQEQFDSLVNDDTITPETLVWCKGMEGWQSLSELQPTTNEEKCEKCHNTFSSEQLESLDGTRVCESCRTVITAEIAAETVSSAFELTYGSLGKRCIAKIIDLTFMLALGGMVEGLSRKLFPVAYTSSTISPVIIITLLVNVLLGIFYITWFVGKFGATPGKMVVKLKITNPSGGKIGYSHAFGRYCGEFIAVLGVMGCLTFFIFSTISSLFPFNQIVGSICGAFLITAAMVYAPALFDPQKRALYDRFCNTRVLDA